MFLVKDIIYGKVVYVSALPRANSCVVHVGSHGRYASIEWTGGKGLGVTTSFRYKNQVGPFGPLTFIGLHTRLWIWSLGTAWEGVRHLISPGL